MQLFNTALQSTTSSGNMVVSYTVKFANGDSCTYTMNVTSCPRAPITQCDKVKFKRVIFPGSSQNYIQVNIQNSLVPTSPICSVIFTKYSSNGMVDPSFFNNGSIVSPYVYINNPNNANINLMPTVANGNQIVFRLFYPSNVSFNGYVKATIIHCNGDTCFKTWAPKLWPPSDKVYMDYTISKAVNPYNKLYAYTFKIKGPSQVPMGEPYKIKYISVEIPDSSGIEIAACTAGEQFYQNLKYDKLKIENSTQSKTTALFEMFSETSINPNDSSGVFQIIFANGIPNKIYYNFYSEDGSELNQGQLIIDTTGTVGVEKLGKNSFELKTPLLFDVYPNPTNGRFACKISLPSEDIVQINITNIEGKLIYTKDLGELKSGLSDFSVDLSSLIDGNYFVNLSCKQSGTQSNTIKLLLVK